MSAHEAALDALIDLVGRGKIAERLEVLKRLGALRDKRADAVLVKVVANASVLEATTAVEALAKFDDPAHTPVFLEALAAETHKRSADAMSGRLMSRQPMASRGTARDQLVRDLRDLRAAAARALGRVGGQVAIDALAASLFDPHETTPRRTITRALKAIGGEQAQGALKEWRQVRRKGAG